MRAKIALITGLLCFPALAYATHDAQLCDSRELVLKALKNEANEQIVSRGLDLHGEMVEVLLSESGSWTIIQTSTDGFTCVLKMGQDWFDLKALKGKVS